MLTESFTVLLVSFFFPAFYEALTTWELLNCRPILEILCSKHCLQNTDVRWHRIFKYRDLWCLLMLCPPFYYCIRLLLSLQCAASTISWLIASSIEWTWITIGVNCFSNFSSKKFKSYAASSILNVMIYCCSFWLKMVTLKSLGFATLI